MTVLMLATLTLGAAIAEAATDQALLAAARNEEPRLIDTLRQMVSIESASNDVEGLQRMAALTAAQLQALGFTVERRPATPGPGADIVLATLRGTGRQRLMLQAHLDTVYPRGTLARQPVRLANGRLYGPGIADDKGGIAVILSALRILLEAGWQDFAKLTVLLNPDEEIGSPGSGELIASLGEQHDTVLSFEPTAAKSVANIEGVLLGTAGIAKVRMTVRGRSSHAGAAPHLGRNALYELAHQLLLTRDIAREVPGTQLNWTVASAPGPSNRIPDWAQAEGDVRTSEPGADKALFEALRERVDGSRLIPNTEVEVEFESGRPPFRAGEKGQRLAELARSIYAEIDRELQFVPTTGGGTDAAFAARSGKPAVLESLGLAGFGFHATDEYVEIDSIVPRLYLATRMLVELGRR